MNAFFSFDLSMVYECEQQLRTINNTRRYEIGHTLNIGCSFVTLREPCNNQRPRCDIACFILQIIYTTVFRVNC